MHEEYGDPIVGIALIIAGSIIFFQNWKQAGDSSRRMAYCGLGIVLGGVLLAFGSRIIALASGGQ